MAEFTPARLQAVNDVPRGDSWRYEPKFDGYRGLLVNGASGKGSVWSRNNKDLGRFFPELLDLASRLPRATVLDGEIVMPTPTGVSFITLQRRLTAARGDSPVAFIAFDILRCGDDLRGQTGYVVDGRSRADVNSATVPRVYRGSLGTTSFRGRL